MLGYLEGELMDKSPGLILVKVGGVGYQIAIPLSTFYALPDPPAQVALQIHTRMQEDALSLYGFSTQEEKDVFLQLLGIPRVGARTALNILSGINPEDFAQTNTCGLKVPAGGSCTFSITFTPTSEGPKSATGYVEDNGGGSPQTVSLSGTGTQ